MGSTNSESVFPLEEELGMRVGGDYPKFLLIEREDFVEVSTGSGSDPGK
jgi:hypothetical protein